MLMKNHCNAYYYMICNPERDPGKELLPGEICVLLQPAYKQNSSPNNFFNNPIYKFDSLNKKLKKKIKINSFNRFFLST